MLSIATRLSRGLFWLATRKRLVGPRREPMDRYVSVYCELSKTEAATSGCFRNLTTLGNKEGGVASTDQPLTGGGCR